MKKEIKKLIAQHLKANIRNENGDWDHNQIRYNQIEVDKDHLENLLDAVWEAAYSKGSHDMADLMNEQASDDIRAASEAGYEKAKEDIRKGIDYFVMTADASAS